ncbi:DUF58 domain-containing protein [Bacillus suaedae]|nr:DUF58 domain-containing protein [Bacillus suaedae]
MRKRLGMIGSYIKYLFLFVMLVILFAYAMFQGGFVSWFLFYSVVTVLVCTVLVTLYPFQVKGVERIVSKDALQAGERLDVKVILYKHPLQPFFVVRVFDRLPENLGKQSGQGALFFFSFQRKLELTYTIDDVKRGVHSFGDVTVAFGDLFGLFELKRNLAVKSDTAVLVYPAYRILESLPLAGNPKHLEGQQNRHSYQEDRALAGVRNYVPGDRLTSIDWKQTARSTSLMTKEFESFQGEGVIVAFDSFVNKKSKAVYERTIELAASMLMTFAKKQSFLQVSVRSDHWNTLSVSKHSLTTGLRLLAQAMPIQDPVKPIDKIYKHWQGMHVYYVSTELDHQLLAACQTMREQKVIVTICMIAITDHDRSFIKEFQKYGIEVIELMNE